MIRIPKFNRFGPIGVDVGARSVKMVQLDSDRREIVDAARWDLGAVSEDQTDESVRDGALVEAIQQLHGGRKFRGRDAVLCLDARDLTVQNVRIAKSVGASFESLVQQEAARRVPFSLAEAEIRFLDAADVRQGDKTMREVILLACHRPVLQRKIDLIVAAGLRPMAVDVEPVAILRCFASQFRRDDDHASRSMFVHVGASNAVAVIAEGDKPLFIKYIETGGTQMDEAVARELKLELESAVALRRHNGDRRSDRQDPEVARSVQHSIRSVVDHLANELSLCVRYHSVTFRGRPLVRLILGGGEASESLAEALSSRLNLKCELGDPLRPFQAPSQFGRPGQWDVAAGLALREVN